MIMIMTIIIIVIMKMIIMTRIMTIMIIIIIIIIIIITRFHALDAVARARGWRLLAFTKSGCPAAAAAVAFDFPHGGPARAYPECAEWARLLRRRPAAADRSPPTHIDPRGAHGMPGCMPHRAGPGRAGPGRFRRGLPED